MVAILFLALLPGWHDQAEHFERERNQARAQAAAQPILETLTHPSGAPVPIHHTPLGVQSSLPGEALEGALSRHASQWVEWSRQTGYEACARICRQDQQYTWTVVTAQGSLFCGVSANQCPAGSMDTGAMAHTHPPFAMTVPAPADILVEPDLDPSEPIWVSSRSFSETDLLYNDVYLITPDLKILHHTTETP